jgi:pimeloyl-ACP methyl ester carboxylesterase
VSSLSPSPSRLRFIANSPVDGLAVAERRVLEPLASVICVHGALDRGGSFVRLARRLTRFDVIVYDRRGYQGSRDLAPVNLHEHIADLRALVTREAQHGPVILFGHSFGGVVTLGTVLADSTGVGLVVNYESPLPWVVRRNHFRSLQSSDPALEAEQFFRRIMGDPAWERLSEQQKVSRRRDGVALLNDLQTVRQSDAPFDLAQLRVPLTYIYGDEADYYASLASALHDINPLITTRVLDNAGHDAHLRNANQLAAVIEDRWVATCASL